MTMDGINLVGVQFRKAGRIYSYVGGEFDLHVGDDVVVDTDRGVSLAKVAELKYIDRDKVAKAGLKPVIRKATDRDMDEQRHVDTDKAERIAKEKAARLGINMHVLKAEAQFTSNKITIYFSSPGRVDFRDLVKDLAGAVKARVELKQVGARDEAKLVGGLGICGREFCCSSFLREFVPVSIKMAKNQNLALNPAKVSGGCGRLLCCLTYENDVYTELRKQLPSKGAKVRVLDDGSVGTVLKTDYLNQLLTVTIPSDLGESKILNIHLKNVEILEKQSVSSRDVDEADLSEAESWSEDLDVGALVARAEGSRESSAGQDQGRGQGRDQGRGQGREQGRGQGHPRSDGQGQNHQQPPQRPHQASGQPQGGNPQREGSGKRKRRRKRKKGGNGQGGGPTDSDAGPDSGAD